ncbi:helix-turn-helix domain-containing protein [Prauserella rugosa]|uniref:helix-turn-helix domain-containing protein n=1 Tax=Prauserella rugosa TaxID=43354 RepID=UPI003CCC68BA
MQHGLEAAKRQGRTGGRPPVVDDDKRRAILARRDEGQSIRQISRGTGVSVGVVHRVVTENVDDDSGPCSELAHPATSTSVS